MFTQDYIREASVKSNFLDALVALENSWQVREGSTIHIMKMLRLTDVRVKERIVKALICDYPYSCAEMLVNQSLNYATLFAISTLYFWALDFNRSGVNSLLLKISRKGADPNMRDLVRILLNTNVGKVKS